MFPLGIDLRNHAGSLLSPGIVRYATAGAGGSSTGSGILDGVFVRAYTTPFPDGHEHIELFTCELLKLDPEKDTSFTSDLFSDDADHRHEGTITAEQKLEIRRGNAVVVQTTDIHPHNWRFPAGEC